MNWNFCVNFGFVNYRYSRQIAQRVHVLVKGDIILKTVWPFPEGKS